MHVLQRGKLEVAKEWKNSIRLMSYWCHSRRSTGWSNLHIMSIGSHFSRQDKRYSTQQSWSICLLRVDGSRMDDLEQLGWWYPQLWTTIGYRSRRRNVEAIYFNIHEVRELEEYDGCKVGYDRKSGWMKLAQTFLLQSFDDEFQLSSIRDVTTPVVPNTILLDIENSGVDETQYKNYRKCLQ